MNAPRGRIDARHGRIGALYRHRKRCRGDVHQRCSFVRNQDMHRRKLEHPLAAPDTPHESERNVLHCKHAAVSGSQWQCGNACVYPSTRERKSAETTEPKAKEPGFSQWGMESGAGRN